MGRLGEIGFLEAIHHGLYLRRRQFDLRSGGTDDDCIGQLLDLAPKKVSIGEQNDLIGGRCGDNAVAHEHGAQGHQGR